MMQIRVKEEMRNLHLSRIPVRGTLPKKVDVERCVNLTFHTVAFLKEKYGKGVDFYLPYKEFISDLRVVLERIDIVLTQTLFNPSATEKKIKYFLQDFDIREELCRRFFDHLMILDLDFEQEIKGKDIAGAFNRNESRVALIKIYNDLTQDGHRISQETFLAFLLEIFLVKVDENDLHEEMPVLIDGYTDYMSTREFLGSLLKAVISKGVNTIYANKSYKKVDYIHALNKKEHAVLDGEFIALEFYLKCLREPLRSDKDLCLYGTRYLSMLLENRKVLSREDSKVNCDKVFKFPVLLNKMMFASLSFNAVDGVSTLPYNYEDYFTNEGEDLNSSIIPSMVNNINKSIEDVENPDVKNIRVFVESFIKSSFFNNKLLDYCVKFPDSFASYAINKFDLGLFLEEFNKEKINAEDGELRL